MDLRLDFPNPRGVGDDLGPAWLLDALDPSRSVVFLDTTLVPAPEERRGFAVSNPVEATLVQRVCAALLELGADPEEVGVISPYRAQLSTVRQAFDGTCEGVEVDTIDRYQGRDKQCIVLSLVQVRACLFDEPLSHLD
jgi:DNA replication ATP-dependent helicase Dna2